MSNAITIFGFMFALTAVVLCFSAFYPRKEGMQEVEDRIVLSIQTALISAVFIILSKFL